MTHGLATTLELLSATENEAAVGVLLPALDSDHADIAAGALKALLVRRSLAGTREILRRMHTAGDGWRAVISEHRGSMSGALRDGILSTDSQLCTNACQAILWFAEFDLMPALVNALEDEANPNAGLAARTALSLTELLYAELAARTPSRRLRDPQHVRRLLTAALEGSVSRFGRHKRPEPVEAFLILSGRDNVTLKQILLDPRHPSYLCLVDLLTHSQQPGVVRLVLSFLDDPHAPSSALSVMSHRGDRKFVQALLRRLRDEPTAAARHNLSRMESLHWLRGERGLLSELSEAEQQGLVDLVLATNINRLSAFEVISHMLAQGQPAARKAAALALCKFQGAQANALTLECLNDPDPRIKAIATSQLRDRGIPGALTMLLDLLDSPEPQVQAAARGSLAEFSVERFLATFDMLDDDVRRTTGALVKKIDTQCVSALEAELESPSRRRRIRALAAAAAMQLGADMEQMMLDHLSDEDHLVRAEAARSLGSSAGPVVVQALQAAQADDSMAVRAAASASLQQILDRVPAALGGTAGATP